MKMNRKVVYREVLLGEVACLVYLAAFKLFLHFYFNRYYGYQRDELYFIACGEHLALGYVDIGPLVPWLGRLSRVVLGESLFALRFLPAVAGALTVLLTGLLVRQLGGGRFAQCLAALAVIIAPVWLLAGNILSLPSFEPLYWVLCAYVIILILKTGNSRLWIWVGLLAGVGLLNKPSMLFFGFGLVVGLLATPNRKYLVNKWLWLGGLIAFIIILPNIFWQIAHGWPTLEFVRNLNEDTMSRISLVEFIAGQVFYTHPLNFPIWLAGLWYYLFSKGGKPYRLLGWIYVAVLVTLVIAKSKIYYLAPAYPMLLAAGALVIESFIRQRNLRWLKAAALAALVLGGAATASVCLPILPIAELDRYVKVATAGVIKNAYELTGTFHDQFGWENQVATVAKVFHDLSPEEQADCMIFAGNFGEAGAIDFYGKAYGLPDATSIHQNYYFWGPGTATGEVAIVFGVQLDVLDNFFGDIEQAATITCEQCVAYENNVPVYVCRKPKVLIKDAWPMLRSVAF